jgi:hypothetical protein
LFPTVGCENHVRMHGWLNGGNRAEMEDHGRFPFESLESGSSTQTRTRAHESPRPVDNTVALRRPQLAERSTLTRCCINRAQPRCRSRCSDGDQSEG